MNYQPQLVKDSFHQQCPEHLLSWNHHFYRPGDRNFHLKRQRPYLDFFGLEAVFFKVKIESMNSVSNFFSCGIHFFHENPLMISFWEEKLRLETLKLFWSLWFSQLRFPIKPWSQNRLNPTWRHVQPDPVTCSQAVWIRFRWFWDGSGFGGPDHSNGSHWSGRKRNTQIFSFKEIEMICWGLEVADWNPMEGEKSTESRRRVSFWSVNLSNEKTILVLVSGI